MNISIGDFSIKVGKGHIFKPKTGNERLHECINIYGITVVHCDSEKHNVPAQQKIDKFTWTSDGKTYKCIIS
jgi:hypothetical protein